MTIEVNLPSGVYHGMTQKQLEALIGKPASGEKDCCWGYILRNQQGGIYYTFTNMRLRSVEHWRAGRLIKSWVLDGGLPLEAGASKPREPCLPKNPELYKNPRISRTNVRDGCIISVKTSNHKISLSYCCGYQEAEILMPLPPCDGYTEETMKDLYEALGVALQVLADPPDYTPRPWIEDSNGGRVMQEEEYQEHLNSED